MKATKVIAVFAAILLLGACAQMSKELNSASTSADQQMAQKRAEMPHCAKPIGTAAVIPPEKNWWTDKQLQSPDALIQFFAVQSNCFRILDRGRGFDVAERERAIAANGELRRGANVGKGQVVAADYLIVPDVITANQNSGGSALGGILGAFVPGMGGVIAAGLQITDHSADVSLSVTDTRSSERVAMTEGKAEKSDIGFGGAGVLAGAGPGGVGFGGAAVSSYTNTELGKVVAKAYLDAYSKLVTQLGGVSSDAASTNVKQAFRVVKVGHLFSEATPKSAPVRELALGALLYPTGAKKGNWYEVDDEMGKHGWVAYQIIELAK